MPACFGLIALALLVPANAAPLGVRQATSAPIPVDPYGAYPTVAFTNDWPLEYRTGEVIQLRWTGGSGVYDRWQLTVKPNYDVSTALSYIVVDDTVIGADYTIVSGGCFREDSFLIFGLQESGTNIPHGERDHDTSPARPLVRGPNDATPLC